MSNLSFDILLKMHFSSAIMFGNQWGAVTSLSSNFSARSWLSKLHGGLWRMDEFSAVME